MSIPQNGWFSDRNSHGLTLAMTYAGIWQAHIFYKNQAVVIGSDGESYVSLQRNNSNVDPTTDSARTHWQPLAPQPIPASITSGVTSDDISVRCCTLLVTGTQSGANVIVGAPTIGLDIVSVQTSPLVITMKPITAAGAETYDIVINGHVNVENNTTNPFQVSFQKIGTSNRFNIVFSQFAVVGGNVQLVPMTNFIPNVSFSIDIYTVYMSAAAINIANSERLARLVAGATGNSAASLAINQNLALYATAVNPNNVYPNASSNNITGSVSAFDLMSENAGLLNNENSIAVIGDQVNFILDTIVAVVDLGDVIGE